MVVFSAPNIITLFEKWQNATQVESDKKNFFAKCEQGKVCAKKFVMGEAEKVKGVQ